jgi:mono/diheme cytochrome c family protein
MGEWLSRRIALAAAIGAVAALAAGCGGSEGGSRTHGGGTQAATTRPASGAATAQLQRGRALFRTNCGACHALRDAGTHGTRAGGEANLDPIKPNSSSVKQFVSHGYGGMPSFKRKLSAEDIDVVARYVAAVDGCGTSSPTSCTGH